MIDSLTPEQTAKFGQYVKYWTEVGLCTKPADRPRAEAAIKWMYKAANLAEPKIVWSGSPKAMYQEKGRQFKSDLKKEIDSDMSSTVYGQHEAYWLAFYRFFRDEVGLVKETEPLLGLWELSESCGWILPFEGICFAAERPCTLKLDENNRLHCETGPACAFPDGYAIYAWHGQAIPKEWIEEKHKLTPKIALNQTNGNLRAAAIQIIGWPKMIDMLEAKIVDKHPEGLAGGELLSVKKSMITPNARGDMKFLRAACPRNGIICFRVPDEIQTAHAAQAWSAGFDKDIYKLPSIRT